MSDRVSDGEITNWSIRHDIEDISLTDLRAMYEDAATFRYDPDKYTEVLTKRLNHHVDSLNMARCVNGGQQWPGNEVIAWMQGHGDTDEKIQAYLACKDGG